MTGHVTALNKDTGKLQTVPAAWVDNPHRFGGAFVTPPADEPTGAAAKPNKAKTPDAEVDTPPAPDAEPAA